MSKTESVNKTEDFYSRKGIENLVVDAMLALTCSQKENPDTKSSGKHTFRLWGRLFAIEITDLD